MHRKPEDCAKPYALEVWSVETDKEGYSYPSKCIWNNTLLTPLIILSHGQWLTKESYHLDWFDKISLDPPKPFKLMLD